MSRPGLPTRTLCRTTGERSGPASSVSAKSLPAPANGPAQQPPVKPSRLINLGQKRIVEATARERHPALATSPWPARRGQAEPIDWVRRCDGRRPSWVVSTAHPDGQGT